MIISRSNTLRPGEQPIPCLRCRSTLPAWEIGVLKNRVLRGGIAVSVETGALVACQACGHVYCVGPQGAFERHDDALPLAPNLRSEAASRVARESRALEDEQPYVEPWPPPVRDRSPV